MKIVWICTFANDEISKIIGKELDTFAPWMTEFINIFKDKQDVFLTIIAPNCYTNKNIHFTVGNIEYYFYKERIISLLDKRSRDLTYNYIFAKNNIIKIVNKIKPDVIHLFGSENPIYATSAIKLMKKYPLLVSIQGLVHESTPSKNIIKRFVRFNRIRIEKQINKNAEYFTSATDQIKNYLQGLNPFSVIYSLYFPTTKPNFSAQDTLKKYDIVYYAKISKDKGITDLLEAIRILKETRPSIKAIIIGGGNSKYIKQVLELIDELDLKNNIVFAGFQTSQQSVFKLAAQARVYVLPTHYDGLPGSIREAMFMKLPVVAYAVGGIPGLNDEKECITLVEKQNIKELVEKIELVLDDTIQTNRLVQNAYEVITERYSNKKIYSNLVNIYQDILTTKNI